MSEFLISHFVKDYKNTKNKKVRESYGYLGGIVGIILNVILSATKITIGLLLNSIAITADGINNLSDVASSVITIVGFKLSSKPADKEHPFGHGRIEYLSGLVVSFMVLLVGFQFIKSSFERILHPTAITFEFVPFIFLLLSIGAKLWLAKFNKFVGKSINSSSLQASSFDAFGDVITSSCVALSLLLSKYTTLPLDGYIGVLVSLFILYSGYSLVKETLNPLLGEAPDPELVEELITKILSYDHVSAVHDLVVHNYGPGRVMASIHAEVPRDISITKIHEIIDTAEKEISKSLNIFLVIHIDPVNTDDKEVAATKAYMLEVLKQFPIVKSIHDFRIIGEGENKNIIFDAVIDSSIHLNSEKEEQLIKAINTELKKVHANYTAMITIDRDFSMS